MKHLFSLALGLLIGGLAVWFWSQEPSVVVVQAAQGRITPTTPQSQPTPQPTRQTASFAELAHLRSDFEQTVALYQMMAGRDAAGIVQLLDDAKTHLRGSDFVAASGILYGRLAELDPERAVARVLNQTGTAQSSWIHAVFHSWARIDLEAALQAAQALGRPFKQIAARAILRSRSDLSTPEQMEIAAALSLQSPPISVDGAFSQSWQEALSQANPNQRSQGLMRIASMWAASDPSAAMQAANAVRSPSLRSSIQAQVAMQWVKQDPEPAIDWVLAQKRSPHQSQLLRQAYAVLAAQDPLAAQQRARALPDKLQNQAMLGVLGPLAAIDLAAASQWLDGQDAPDLRSEAIHAIAAGVGQLSTDKTDQWFATLSKTEAAFADSTITSILVHSDPEQAARRVQQQQDPQRRRNAAESLVRNWANQDVDAAAKWIAKIPVAERGPLYQTLTQNWGLWDTEAAQTFAERLPDEEHRNRALIGLLNSPISFEDAQRAYTDISDSALKTQAAAQLYYRYQQSHPEAVEPFRRAAGIDAGATIQGRNQP